MTYPGDFHLSTTLIRSLRHFHPHVPICIIPGEGFNREDHPFETEILREPDGFWGTLGHQSRDFWAFQGPFEIFLYLDADIICTGSIDSLFTRIQAQEGSFFFAHICFSDQKTWESIIADKDHPMHESAKSWVKRGLGNPELLVRFDADYDPYARSPFNSGIFASRRGAITEADVRAFHEKEVSFYATALKREFTWESCDVFYSDQGRLNYLVDRLNLPIQDLAPDGHDCWAGDIIEKVTLDEFLSNKLEFKFIHWAGVPRPRPSIFCEPAFRWLDPFTYNFDDYRRYKGYPEIPGYALWRYFQVKNEYPFGMKARLESSYSDLRRLAGSLKDIGLECVRRSARAWPLPTRSKLSC